MLANIENRQGAPRDAQASLAVSLEIAHAISDSLRARRKELHLSQSALAHLSGVSLGSLKRFEQESLISLESLIKLSVVLGYEKSFSKLFCEQEQEPEPEQVESLEDMVAQTHQLLDRIVLYQTTNAHTNEN